MIASLGIIPRSIDASPTGRLAHFIANWRLMTKDRWVQNTVRGYEIEFVSHLHQSKEPHPTYLNQAQQQLVRQEITELCRKGAVTELKTPAVGGLVSTLFLVPKKDGGQRPVINLKSLNSFVDVHTSRWRESIPSRDLLHKEDWLIKIDLKDVYFSIPVSQGHRKFLLYVSKSETNITSSTASHLA